MFRELVREADGNESWRYFKYMFFTELTSRSSFQVYVVVDHVSVKEGRWRTPPAVIRRPMTGCTLTH